MKKITVRLKQHTPLIHFQGNISGATLRASEVKPKLDRWIIENVFGGYLNIDKYRDHLIGTSKDKAKIVPKGDTETERYNSIKSKSLALDYSLRIKLISKTNSTALLPNSKDYAPFFGNMGKDYKTTFLNYPENFQKEIIELSFKTKNSKIAKEVESNISNFFLKTNFMTRSSKGFGSFTVSSINGQNVALNINSLYFTIRCNNYNYDQFINTILPKINLFTKAIRSGINLPNNNQAKSFYFKSCLFQYLYQLKPSIQWDKKTIKNIFFNHPDELEYLRNNRKKNKDEKKSVKFVAHQAFDLRNNEDESPNTLSDFVEPEIDNSIITNLHDYRDSLGLSSNEKWHSYIGALEKKVSYNGTTIDRIPSTLLIKPIYINGQMNIHILQKSNISNGITEKSIVEYIFDHSNQKLINSNLVNIRDRQFQKSFKMRLAGFDWIEGYLAYLYANKNNFQSNGNGTNNEGSTLNQIFNSLRKDNPYVNE